MNFSLKFLMGFSLHSNDFQSMPSTYGFLTHSILSNLNIRKADLKTEATITNEHVKNNQDVRALLLKSGIEPENLPAEEDLKKIERKVKSEDKKLLKEIKKLKKK